MPKAIVIGAGFGGIASALRLRHKGYDVTLIDKQDKLGGRAYQYHRQTPLGTFVHDAGPTVITAKFLFDELFELFGKKREDYVEFRDVFPWYRIQFADKTQFNYGGTTQQMEAEIAKISPPDVEGFRKYLLHSKRIFDVGFTELGAVPFHKFGTMLKCAPDLIKLQNYKTVWGMAEKYIQSDKLRRVFSFQPLLVGGNPFNTTSIYSLIFYLEREWGVQFAMGGTGQIIRGFEKLMQEEGITVRSSTEVKHIDISDGEPFFPNAIAPTFGYQTTHGYIDRIRCNNGEVIECSSRDGDVVVANADAPHVYTHLIDKKYHKGTAPRRLAYTSKTSGLKYSMGLFVYYFGTNKQYPEVAHHTIVLGKEYKGLIDTLFEKRDIETDDLSVYIHRPTATDPTMAPSGCESFYVLVPVPNLQPRDKSLPQINSNIPQTPDGLIDWKLYGDTFKQHVIDYLQRTILPGLRECLVDDFYVTPEHFATNLNTFNGSGFSIQPLFSQSAYFRFHNKAPGIEGLYFVGAATHPGAGMPGVLCSAKVLDHLVPVVK